MKASSEATDVNQCRCWTGVTGNRKVWFCCMQSTAPHGKLWGWEHVPFLKHEPTPSSHVPLHRSRLDSVQVILTCGQLLYFIPGISERAPVGAGQLPADSRALGRYHRSPAFHTDRNALSCRDPILGAYCRFLSCIPKLILKALNTCSTLRQSLFSDLYFISWQCSLYTHGWSRVKNEVSARIFLSPLAGNNSTQLKANRHTNTFYPWHLTLTPLKSLQSLTETGSPNAEWQKADCSPPSGNGSSQSKPLRTGRKAERTE